MPEVTVLKRCDKCGVSPGVFLETGFLSNNTNYVTIKAVVWFGC
jgi:hypothetical protein